MNFARPRRFVAAWSFATPSTWLSAVLALALAATAGCKDPPPIPTTGSDVRRTLMQPDSEVKVRTLIELAEKSKETFDMPTMRQTLVEATDSAQKLSEAAPNVEAQVTAAELLTTISEMLVREQWERESQRSITNARIAAATITDTSKKVAALTNLAVALHRSGESTNIAASIIKDADKIVAGITAPENRVPQLAALHAAWLKLGNPDKQAEASLAAATTLAEKIEDPAKRTAAETNAASASFRGDQKATGRSFYEAALVSAEKITDPAAKASALIDLVEILHPFRSDLPIEQPLQTAIDTAAKIPAGKAKDALTKRIDALPKAPPRKAPPSAVP